MWFSKKKKKREEEKERAKSKSEADTQVLSEQLKQQNGELGDLRSKINTKHRRVHEKADECLRKIRSSGLSKA